MKGIEDDGELTTAITSVLCRLRRVRRSGHVGSVRSNQIGGRLSVRRTRFRVHTGNAYDRMYETMND